VDRAYVVSTRVVGGIIFLVGLVMIAVTLGRGGGPLAVGVVFGVLFTLLGAGRLWISRGA
jgi:ABC-type transporter Mla maintaining outer membrane lipid asymmetry permease subunit MlaE